MKTKHTPGEWIAKKYSGTRFYAIECNATRIAEVDFGRVGLCTPNRAEANAKLIAAAPELLEACLEVDELFKDTKAPTTEIITMLSRVNEAIEKATS